MKNSIGFVIFGDYLSVLVALGPIAPLSQQITGDSDGINTLMIPPMRKIAVSVLVALTNNSDWPTRNNTTTCLICLLLTDKLNALYQSASQKCNLSINTSRRTKLLKRKAFQNNALWCELNQVMGVFLIRLQNKTRYVSILLFYSYFYWEGINKCVTLTVLFFQHLDSNFKGKISLT